MKTPSENRPQNVTESMANTAAEYLLNRLDDEGTALSMGGRAETCHPSACWRAVSQELVVLASVWIYDESGTSILMLGEGIGTPEIGVENPKWAMTWTLKRGGFSVWES